MEAFQNENHEDNNEYTCMYTYIYLYIYIYPGIPTTIQTMGVNITTIAYLRVLIIEIGQIIILTVVEAQGIYICIYIYIYISIRDMNKILLHYILLYYPSKPNPGMGFRKLLRFFRLWGGQKLWLMQKLEQLHLVTRSKNIDFDESGTFW